jgi:hypothetical protein
MEAAELCQDRFLGLSDFTFLVNMLLVDFWPFVVAATTHLLLLQKSLQTFESLTALILFFFLFFFLNSAQQRWTATHQHIPPQLQWRMMKGDEHSLPDRRQHTVYGINFNVVIIMRHFSRRGIYVQLSFELSNADSTSWLGSNMIRQDSTN